MQMIRVHRLCLHIVSFCTCMHVYIVCAYMLCVGDSTVLLYYVSIYVIAY